MAGEEANDRLTRAENDGLGVVNPCVRVDEDAPRRGCCKRRRVLGPRRSGRRRGHRASDDDERGVVGGIFRASTMAEQQQHTPGRAAVPPAQVGALLSPRDIVTHA